MDTTKYVIYYRKGTEQAHADAFSRLPLPNHPDGVPVLGEIVLLIEHLALTPVSSKQVRVWTDQNPILAKIKQ